MLLLPCTASAALSSPSNGPLLLDRERKQRRISIRDVFDHLLSLLLFTLCDGAACQKNSEVKSTQSLSIILNDSSAESKELIVRHSL